MRKSLIILLTCISMVVWADSMCDQTIEQGKIKFYNGQYKEALLDFEWVAKDAICSDYHSLANEWIAKCKSAIERESKKTQTATPKQTPTPAKLSVSTQNIRFSQYGGTLSTQITCNKEWGFTYLYKDASHQSRSYDFEVKKEGDKLLITCPENHATSTKHAQFDVFVRGDVNVRYTIYLSQDASPSYNISATPLGTEFSSGGGVTRVLVQSNTGWYVESCSNWLGYRNKTSNSIEVFCNKNNSSSELHGKIVLRTTNGNKTTTIYFKQYRSWQPVQPESYHHKNASELYMEYNGCYSVTWAQVGVSYGYPCNFDVSAFDFRLYWFELSIINFGWQSDYLRSNWYWQPNLRFYIPFDLDWAVVLSGGPKLNFLDSYEYGKSSWNKMDRKWWFNAQLGFHWDWHDYFGSEFYIRYNGCVAVGATINIHTGF